MRTIIIAAASILLSSSIYAQSHRDHLLGISTIITLSNNGYVDEIEPSLSYGLSIEYKYYFNDIFTIGGNISRNKYFNDNSFTTIPVLITFDLTPNIYDDGMVFYGLGVGAIYLNAENSDIASLNNNVALGIAPEFGYCRKLWNRLYFYQMLRYNKAIIKDVNISYFSGTIGFSIRI